MGKRDRRLEEKVPPLAIAGVAVQLVGSGAQALFHLSGQDAPWLTERRTSVIDHVLSNAGVLCLVWQAGRWMRSRSAWSNTGRRVMVIGVGLEAVGAIADGVGHAVGGEHRLPLVAIATGYVTVSVGLALVAVRSRSTRGTRR